MTNTELLKCAERELKMRKRVYPGWVKANQYREDDAAHEIACMMEIVSILKARVDAETPDLFNQPNQNQPNANPN